MSDTVLQDFIGRTALHHLPAHPIHAFAAGHGLGPAAALSYARARHAWSLRLARARAQQEAWRTAAFASFAVSILLAASLASSVLGSSVAAHVIEGPRPTEIRGFADRHAQLAKTLVALDHPAELLPASLPRRGSNGMTKE